MATPRPTPDVLQTEVSRAYPELRTIAVRFLSRERRDHTLQPTALVHEAYLRLAREATSPDLDTAGLLAAAASVMRRVLVDHARRHGAHKRGRAPRREPLDEALLLYEEKAIDLLALDEALEHMEAVDPELSRIVELRFFGGLTEAETATVLGLSTRSVRRGWKTARLWLLQVLRDAR